jgi:hypothetical protein
MHACILVLQQKCFKNAGKILLSAIFWEQVTENNGCIVELFLFYYLCPPQVYVHLLYISRIQVNFSLLCTFFHGDTSIVSHGMLVYNIMNMGCYRGQAGFQSLSATARPECGATML